MTVMLTRDSMICWGTALGLFMLRYGFPLIGHVIRLRFDAWVAGSVWRRMSL